MFLNRSFWFVILLNILIKLGADCHSGWFEDDNGVSQTILKENLSPDYVLKMQNDILNMLELPEKPQLDASTKRSSVPKFLLKIYKQLSEKDDELDEETNPNEDGMFLKPRYGRDVSDDDGISDEISKIIDESNFIATFLNNRNAISPSTPDNRTHLSFDLSEISPNVTQSLLSELHLYKKRNRLKTFENATSCVITIYAINIVDGTKAMRPMHTLNTTVDYEGWIRIDFTLMLNQWLIKSLSNNLLFITMNYENDEHETFELTTPDTNNLLSFWNDEHQPFVTAYFTNDNILRHPKNVEITKKHRRAKRSLQNPRLPLRKNRSDLKSLNPLINKNAHTSLDRPCQRYMLYIRFQDLQWDWIVAPEGYNAYYCAGQCNLITQSHQVDFTNHAMIQSFVHLHNPKIPLPCCAPTKLGSISVLYIPKETSVHLRKYPEMIAKSCGCQ